MFCYSSVIFLQNNLILGVYVSRNGPHLLVKMKTHAIGFFQLHASGTVHFHGAELEYGEITSRAILRGSRTTHRRCIWVSSQISALADATNCVIDSPFAVRIRMPRVVRALVGTTTRGRCRPTCAVLYCSRLSNGDRFSDSNEGSLGDCFRSACKCLIFWPVLVDH